MDGRSKKDDCTSAARREGQSTCTGEKASGKDEKAAACEGEGTLAEVAGSPVAQTGVGIGPWGAPRHVSISTASGASQEKWKDRSDAMMIHKT